MNRKHSCRICFSQPPNSHVDRRRLTRGETIDSGGPFCHSQTQHDPSGTQIKSLTRCHTISQDLTRHSLQTPEHISTADETDELFNELQESTDLAPEPEQVHSGSASGRDERKEDERYRGGDVDLASTEMDSVVL